MGEAWDRQPLEPEDAWKAFVTYRDQVPPRRLEYAAIKGTAAIRAWYNEYHWQDRVVAFDNHNDALQRKEREDILREDARDRAARMIGLCRSALSVCEREMRKLEAASRATDAFGQVKVSDLNRLMVNAITLERLVRGESTENVATVDVDLERLSVEELRTFRDLQRKLAGDEGEEPRH